MEKHDNNAVEVRDLTVAYDRTPVLENMTVDIPKGSLTAVVGPNGAGKSTFVKAVLGLIPILRGSIFFPAVDGRKPVSGYVPQSESVDWDFPATVLDVVLMGCYGRLGWFRRPGKNEKNTAIASLRQMGMEDYKDRQISRLSGGQQQRVFLARALAQEADIYFMDEPFKGVDINTEERIVELLRDMRSCRKTVVVVHHNLETVTEYFDRVILINGGLVAAGPVEEVFTKDNIRLAFRGVCGVGGVERSGE